MQRPIPARLSALCTDTKQVPRSAPRARSDGNAPKRPATPRPGHVRKAFGFWVLGSPGATKSHEVSLPCERRVQEGLGVETAGTWWALVRLAHNPACEGNTTQLRHHLGRSLGRGMEELDYTRSDQIRSDQHIQIVRLQERCHLGLKCRDISAKMWSGRTAAQGSQACQTKGRSQIWDSVWTSRCIYGAGTSLSLSVCRLCVSVSVFKKCV